MIKFLNLGELKDASNILTEDERTYLYELTDTAEYLRYDGFDVAYAIKDCCLIVRTFSFGRYEFYCPLALSERADEEAALLAVNEYAMREELPRKFVDVPETVVPVFLRNFHHLNIDRDGSCFCVCVKTECELLDKITPCELDGFSVGALLETDTEDYARLVRDEETNRYWGYDYREDYSDKVSDSFFLENANLEFEYGTAINLAIRKEKVFIGEATLYAFDGMGGAEFAIRLLPEHRGKRYSKKAFEVVVKYAKSIGLIRLSSYVDKRNVASLRFSESDTRVKFSRSVY